MCRLCSLICVILAGYVSSLENSPEHATKQAVATVLFVVFNVLLFGVFASRGIAPALSTAQQLYHKLTQASPRENELGKNLEALSGPLLEGLENTEGATRCSIGLESLDALAEPRGRAHTFFLDAGWDDEAEEDEAEIC